MLSVVVPTYNEAVNVRALAEGVCAALASCGEAYELIFVDDASPDGTAAVVEELMRKHPNIRLVRRAEKGGIGGAHLAGFAAAQGDTFLTLDADLSHDPEDLLRLRDALDAGADMAIASRYVAGGGQVGKAVHRALGSRLLNLLGSLLLGLRVRDASHTFRALRRSVYERIRGSIGSTGHPSFEVELTYRAARAGFAIVEIPALFHERPREGGKSKLDLRREVWGYLRCLLHLRRETRWKSGEKA